jgi:hypothetical protein
MPDMIKIDLGGANTEMVQSTKGGTAELQKLENQVKDVKRAMDGHNQTQDKAKQKTDAVKNANQRLKSEMGGLGNVLNTAKQAAMGFIAGWVGIEGIRRAWALVKDEIQAVVAAQERLADQSRTMEGVTKAVMNQTNMSWEASGELVQRITRAGRFDNLGQTQSTINLASAAWMDSDNPSDTNWQEMAATVADFAGRKGLGAEETGMLIEVLKKFGAMDPQTAEQRMGQIWAASRASMAEFSPFVRGLSVGVPEMIAQGAAPETGLGLMVASREIKSTSMASGEMMRQISTMMNKEEVMGTLAGRQGMGVQEWYDQDYTAKFAQFSEYVSGTGLLELQESLRGEELSRAMVLFSPEGVARMNAMVAGFRGLTNEDYDLDQAGYPRQLANIEEIRAETALTGGSATSRTMTGRAWQLRGGEALAQIREGGTPSGLTEEQADKARGIFPRVYGDPRETANIVSDMMQNEWEAMRERLIAGGQMTATSGGNSFVRQYAYENAEVRRLDQGLREQLVGMADVTFEPDSPAAYAPAAEMLVELQQITYNTGISGDTNSGYHD